MNKKLSCFGAACALILVGCTSRMAVKVQLYNDENPACLPAVTRLRTDLKVAAEEAAVLESRVPVVRSEILAVIDKLLADPKQMVPDPPSVRQGIAGKLDEYLSEIVSLRRQGMDAYYAGDSNPDEISARNHFWNARLKFLAGNRAVYDLFPQLEKLGTLIFKVQDGRLQAPLEPLRIHIQSALTSRALVLEDPLAPLITEVRKKNQLPDCWNSLFNTAKASASTGNTDIAIVMTGLGDFSIKGVRLDAAAVTAAAFDGITSGISIVAAASGLSGKLAGGSTGTPAPAATAPKFENAGRLEAREGTLDPAVRDFLRTLLVHRNELDDAAARKAAIIEVKQTYQALRLVLNPAASATPVITAQ